MFDGGADARVVVEVTGMVGKVGGAIEEVVEQDADCTTKSSVSSSKSSSS